MTLISKTSNINNTRPIHIFTRNINICNFTGNNTTYLNNYPYNAIFHNLLNNEEMKLSFVLENYKIYKEYKTKSNKIVFKGKNKLTLIKILEQIKNLDNKNQTLYKIINQEKIINEIQRKIKTKESFELLLIKRNDPNKEPKSKLINIVNYDHIIKTKHLYIGLEWKCKKHNLIFKKYYATLTLSIQINGQIYLCD